MRMQLSAQRQASGELDDVDEWIHMVTLNRLTGHSPSFLSVYTARRWAVVSKQRINARRRQAPPRHGLRRVVSARSAQLLEDVDDVRARLAGVRGGARQRPAMTRTEGESVHLVVRPARLQTSSTTPRTTGCAPGSWASTRGTCR